MAVWRNVVDSTNIDFMWDPIDERLLELVCILEAQVATVDVIGECERELALVEVRRMGAIVQGAQLVARPLH